MEIGENAEKSSKNTCISHVQSSPTFNPAEDDENEKEDENESKKIISKKRRVSFASSKQLAQYLEPINPFLKLSTPISTPKELSSLYRQSCEKHKTVPIPSIVEHLETISLERSSSVTAAAPVPVTTISTTNTSTTASRTEVLNLRHETLTHESCEALEELFKNVKYKTIDLTSCSLDDISASAIFDMIEYYEACNELNISDNPNIKNLGWQSCINMIKRSTALQSLVTRGTPLQNDQQALHLGNALSSLSSHIYTLKLEQCGLSGRHIMGLCGALQKNRTLKELCLANNQLNSTDAKCLGNVLKCNFHLQLLDISNNNIQNDGFLELTSALNYQSVHVNQTNSSCNSVSSASGKFDFGDLTASLNNINNNRQRSCATPPPMPKIKLDNAIDDGGAFSQINNNNNNNNNNINNNNNNNSILQCDNDDKKVEDEKEKQQQGGGEDPLCVDEEERKKTAVATGVMESSTKSENENASKENDEGKFKYTTASLSPISQSYDDSSTNHQLFNAERSFSSESLCSETSIESNDSKSSIRLIENKFNNRNGTLERQQTQQVYATPYYYYVDEKQPTGLQVLILWNNNITSESAASAFEMFDSAECLQIVNFGQNPIGNEFLMETRAALKSNKSLTSIGLQATAMTCEGLKCIAEIIDTDGNSSLQRIDLRSNEFTVSSINALYEALKSNKSLIQIDLDDNESGNSEYQDLVKRIRERCTLNETPIDKAEQAVLEKVPRTLKTSVSTRKISLTCQSVKVPPKQSSLEKQHLEPKNIGRSPSPSPLLSPLPSPSRSRFQVSRVSASESSPSPSSSSGSPTFFPSSTKSRFRVVAIPEPQQKVIKAPSTDDVDVSASKIKPQPSKEIDIPQKVSSSHSHVDHHHHREKTTILNISSPSSLLLSSQSCEQLDSGVKSFIDFDSCSSFSSSIESIDHPTDMSSTESFDFIDKSPIIVEPLSEPLKILEDDDKKEVFSNENTLVSTSSSSSSNEGLTLTTNSPTAELSPKNDAQKRVRKSSWILSGSKSENYPATLDKLINLFHHPTSIFTKTSPESTLSSSPTTTKPKTSQSKDEKLSSMGQKENSLSGFFTSLVSLTKKDEKLAANESQILQNISPENTVGKLSPQMTLESLPKNIKQEMKENISPENTISSEHLAEIEKQKTTKVVFLVGDESSLDIPDIIDEMSDELPERSESEGQLSLGDETTHEMTTTET